MVVFTYPEGRSLHAVSTQEFIRMVEKGKKYMTLQSKMMDLGWKLHYEGEDEYFTHPTYGDMRVTVWKLTLPRFYNSRVLKFPMISHDEDPHGLGCSLVSHCAGRVKEIVSNEWTSYWDTRRGRKRAKYLKLVQKREEKRKFVEAAIARDEKARKLEYRHTY